MRTLLKRIEGVIERLLGVFGGAVFAVAVSLAVLYLYGVFQFHVVIVLAVPLVGFPLFGLLGMVWPKYFGRFGAPVLNVLLNLEEGNPGGPGIADSFRNVAALLTFLFGMLALFVGAWFQLHVVFALGVVLFLSYATWAPGAFGHDDKAGDQKEKL
jgi:hypothetical protein